jgi:xylono-1,5-lactonase
VNTPRAETSQIEANVACVWPARATLGEGPCWDTSTRKLYWTDIKGARLHAYSPKDGHRETWALPCRVGSVGLPPPGWNLPPGQGTALLACGDPGLMWLILDAGGATTVVIAHPEAHLPHNRFNDGKIGPDGRYWAGTMHDPETEASGSLYAFAPDGSVMQLDSGYRVTNGPAFSPDGRTVYHNDSALRTIFAFDLGPDGRLANKRVFIQFAPSEGYPDGMTTDREGNLFVAMWDGARIEKISPQGVRLGHMAIPTPRVTSCTFDGDSTVLYATSASIGLPENDPLAGGLFKIDLVAA